MTNRAFDWLSLIVVAAIIATLAAKPQVIGTFFGGFSNVLGTALSPVTKGR